MVQIDSNYRGAFFMEIPTGVIMRDSKLLSELNAITKRIINDLDKPGVTTWEFFDFSTALQGVLLLQERAYPFKLLGDKGLLFIEVLP
jgi:hypothetical protein